MKPPASPLRILVVLVILFIPAISYYFLTKGKNNFRTLEVFGPKKTLSPHEENGKMIADTVFHTIPSFSFTDQDGKTFTDQNLSGSIYIAAFFFTGSSDGEVMNTQLERVQSKFKDDADVKILTFTVDPDNDSVPVLATYAKSRRAIPGKWYFLTGDKKALDELARNGYYLFAMLTPGHETAMRHSDQLVLVDKDKRIRGYYDGTDNLEVNRLMDEVVVLQWEYKKNDHD